MVTVVNYRARAGCQTMLALWVVVLALIWLLPIFHALVVNAVLLFAVFKTLALILKELELHSPALLLYGLYALILPLQSAQVHIALNATAVFHCVVLTLNVMQATLQEMIPEPLLAYLALARMMFAAEELCARLPILAAARLSMCRNLTSRLSLALDQLALIKTAAETNVRTSCVMRASRRTIISIVLVSHAPTLSAVRNKLNVLRTTHARLVMC
jgi:hypothetical protein